MPKIINWNETLSINNPIIDGQHKELIEHLNKLTTAVNNHEGPTVISSTINFLNEYTNFHFSSEEKIMSENNYSDYEQHKASHKEFINTLNNLVQDFDEDGATHSLAGSIDTLLVNWLINHIQKTDKKLGNFLNKK